MRGHEKQTMFHIDTQRIEGFPRSYVTSFPADSIDRAVDSFCKKMGAQNKTGSFVCTSADGKVTRDIVIADTDLGVATVFHPDTGEYEFIDIRKRHQPI